MLSTLVLCLLGAICLAAEGPPPAHTIRGVPLVEQAAHWCGPSSLAAVLQYHGETVSPGDIADEIYLPDYRGSLNVDLLLYARRRDFDAWAGEGSDDVLRRAIAQNRPVICMVRRGNALARRNHFVVVSGYDSARGVWVVDSGAGKLETQSEAAFEAEWSECDRWALVVEGRKVKQAEERPPE